MEKPTDKRDARLMFWGFVGIVIAIFEYDIEQGYKFILWLKGLDFGIFYR